MKKVLSFVSLFLLGLCGYTASAQGEILFYDGEIEVEQIEDLQWKITFVGANSVSFRDQYDYDQATGGPLEGRTAYVENYDTEERTYIYEDVYDTSKQIYRPAWGNSIVVNLGNLKPALPDGDYILNIPETYLRLTRTGWGGDRFNEEFETIITIGDKVSLEHEVSFTSTDGNNYSDITWTNVVHMEPGNTTGAYMINKETSQRYELQYLKDYEFSKANFRIIDNVYLRLNLTNNYPNLPDGTYLIYIPANYVLFNGGTTGNDAVEGYELKYSGPWMEGPVEVNGPDANGVFTVNWVSAESISFNPSFSGDPYSGINGVVIQDLNEVVNFPISTDAMSIDGTTLTISMEGIVLYNDESGNRYRLYVPEEYLLIKNAKGEWGTDGVYYLFNYTGGGDDPNQKEEYKVYNQDAVWSIAEDPTYEGIIDETNNPITIWWPNVEIEYNTVTEHDPVNIHEAETYGNIELEYGKDFWVSENKIWIDFSDVPSEMWRINIPEGLVLVKVAGDDTVYLNQASSMDDVFIAVDTESGDGVESILNSKDGVFSVYNFNGVKVLETKDASEVNALPKGFYIVNGKKIVVK